MRRGPARRAAWRIAAAGVLGWAGMFVHNQADLPGQTVLSPESLLPLLLTLLLVAGVLTRFRRAAVVALLCWGLLQLVGGGVLSVLPLPFLPFAPAQTVGHYAMHAVYAAAQVPLIVLTSRELASRGRGAMDRAAEQEPR